MRQELTFGVAFICALAILQFVARVDNLQEDPQSRQTQHSFFNNSTQQLDNNLRSGQSDADDEIRRQAELSQRNTSVEEEIKAIQQQQKELQERLEQLLPQKEPVQEPARDSNDTATQQKTKEEDAQQAEAPQSNVLKSKPNLQQSEQQSAKENETIKQPDSIQATATRIISYYNTTDRMMKDFPDEFFSKGFCNRMFKDENQKPVKAAANMEHTRYDVRFSCSNLFKHSSYGTGNYISAFYGLRLAAETLGNVDVSIQCNDAEKQKADLILPWLMGSFPRTIQNLPPANRTNPTIDLACKNYKSIPIGYKYHDMRYEFRRMAIAMVGIPYPGHPSEAWAEEHLFGKEPKNSILQLPTPNRDTPPIYPDTELDEAVLHFRCGDLISSNHPSFGFMKFGSFSRHLNQSTKTIGIVTQPFTEAAQTREAEGGQFKRDRCKLVVYEFVTHLQERFPDAKISIRNNANETIALTFARMIMAQQLVIGITSFGVFPGVSTFGTSYIREPDYFKAPNRWLLNPRIEDVFDNVKLIKEPKLMAAACKRRWGEDGAQVLAWFKNYSMPVSR